MHVFSTRNLPVAILATRGRGSRRGCYTLEKDHLPALGEITIWYHGRTARLQRSPKRGRSQVQAAIAREKPWGHRKRGLWEEVAGLGDGDGRGF